ncbi:LecA/PA-IL family lectin [Mesorhizobium sp. RMAD-H1]|uniref:LecA/PA-IL family lectin n=1 Tax=Mesorhizobium sp. RMAD-H1 TaxID=2587065 RepID=UPI001615DAD4|nr:LecA/PA-IL family lectin [Mesorhizobium sp. RMAD-H1]MBB2972845.1 hypothetical protein [Mesorhizobium sp. RMAD-H1]
MAEQTKLWSGTLQANAEQGVKTGLTLNTRDPNITITVTGTTKFGSGFPEVGPEGDPNYTNPKVILPSANEGACLMKIGDHLMKVGAGLSDWTIRYDGELTFLYNDVPGEYADNTGAYNINITKTPVVWNGTLEATNEQGVKTGVTVNTADKITITVTGEGTSWPGHGPFGPDGFPGSTNQFDPSANSAAVLMRIGTGPYRLVGTGISDWPVAEDGEIAFFYNDAPGAYGDNSGSFEITLTVY